MKKLKFIIFSLVVFLAFGLLTGCIKDAKESTQNGNFIVEFLFEQNGCKMYRFKDGSHYIYWSDCRGKTCYYAQAGKVTHYIEEITSNANVE